MLTTACCVQPRVAQLQVGTLCAVTRCTSFELLNVSTLFRLTTCALLAWVRQLLSFTNCVGEPLVTQRQFEYTGGLQGHWFVLLTHFDGGAEEVGSGRGMR